ESLLRSAFALPTSSLVQWVNKRQLPLFLSARARAEEALAGARTLIAHSNLVVQALGHVEAGYAQLARGQFAEAAAESNQAVAALKRNPAGARLVALPLEGLQGEFFLRTGQREKGRQVLEAVMKKARAAPGPDEWSQALFTLESIARAAREIGDWEFARRTSVQMLEHDAAYAGTHYALALVAEHDADRRAAGREFALAEKFWNNGDPDLSELREIRAWLRANGPAKGAAP
ncbi:MAG: hypothetical protein HYZ58_20005, partial [Acidobacteria bacterium]|nr:hypothetical protein [Acidobacteriota bacterium]